MAYQDVGTDPGTSQSTTDTAKDQAGRVGQTAAQAGGEVAQTTKEQAGNVVGEVKQQARDLLGEARGQARYQAGSQKGKAVSTLHGLGDELEQMAGSAGGIGAEVARQASERTRDLARYLDQHEPADLLDQVRTYARRRPVAFLAGAAIAGVVAGRLTRGLASKDDDTQGTPALDGGRATGYEPLAVEPAYNGTPAYEPTPGYGTPTGYETAPAYETGYQGAPGYETAPAYEPGYQPPADGGFRAPDQPFAEPYPADQPYPGTTGHDPAYQQDRPDRGWTP